MKLNFDYVSVLAQVNLIEIPIYYAFYRRLAARAFAADTGVGHALKIAGLVVLVNLCVHPIVFFGFMGSGRSYLWSVLAGQAFMLVAEAFLQTWAARIDWKRALLAASVANLASWQVTPVISYWLYG